MIPRFIFLLLCIVMNSACDSDSDTGSINSADIDGDGVLNAEDFYPADGACYKETDGNGTFCYLTILSLNISNEEKFGEVLFAKRGDNLVIYSTEINRLIELDSETNSFTQVLPGDVEITSLAYSEAHDRIYLNLSDSNDISFVNDGELSVLTTLDVSPIELLAIEDKVFVYSKDDIYFIDKEGIEQHFKLQRYGLGSQLYYDESTNNIFSGYEIYYDEFSAPTSDSPRYKLKKIDIARLNPDKSNYTSNQEYRMLDNGINSISSISDDFLLVGTDIINKHSLQRLRTLDVAGENTTSVIRDDGLLSIMHGKTQTVVSQFDNKLNLISQQEFEGDPLLLFGEKSQFVLSKGEAQLYVHRIDDLEDIDSDGVSNAIDAFPADPAASIDADGDGSPEQWNEGSSAADSTENLTLDVFPNDAYCWLVDHANADGSCDYGPREIDFAPTNITKSNDVIYMLGETSEAIVYRWSIAAKQYLPPILLNDLGFFNSMPTAIAFVEAHQQLYVSYIDGTVSYFDQGTLSSNLLTTFRRPVFSMLAAGDYLYVPQKWLYPYSGDFTPLGAVAFSVSFDGKLTESGEFEGFSAGVFAQYRSWDKANNVLWTGHEREDGNFYKRILQDSENGELTGVNIDGTSDLDGPYKLDDNYRSTNVLVIASPSGQQLLIGNGGIYNVEDDTWQQTPNNVDYAVWTSDEQLVTLEQNEQGFILHHHNEQYDVIKSLNYEGSAHQLVLVGEEIFVLRQDEQGFHIEVYEPN